MPTMLHGGGGESKAFDSPWPGGSAQSAQTASQVTPSNASSVTQTREYLQQHYDSGLVEPGKSIEPLVSEFLKGVPELHGPQHEDAVTNFIITHGVGEAETAEEPEISGTMAPSSDDVYEAAYFRVVKMDRFKKYYLYVREELYDLASIFTGKPAKSDDTRKISKHVLNRVHKLMSTPAYGSNLLNHWLRLHIQRKYDVFLDHRWIMTETMVRPRPDSALDLTKAIISPDGKLFNFSKVVKDQNYASKFVECMGDYCSFKPKQAFEEKFKEFMVRFYNQRQLARSGEYTQCRFDLVENWQRNSVNHIMAELFRDYIDPNDSTLKKILEYVYITCPSPEVFGDYTFRFRLNKNQNRPFCSEYMNQNLENLYRVLFATNHNKPKMTVNEWLPHIRALEKTSGPQPRTYDTMMSGSHVSMLIARIEEALENPEQDREVLQVWYKEMTGEELDADNEKTLFDLYQTVREELNQMKKEANHYAKIEQERKRYGLREYLAKERHEELQALCEEYLCGSQREVSDLEDMFQESPEYKDYVGRQDHLTQDKSRVCIKLNMEHYLRNLVQIAQHKVYGYTKLDRECDEFGNLVFFERNYKKACTDGNLHPEGQHYSDFQMNSKLVVGKWLKIELME